MLPERFYLGVHRPNWLWDPDFDGIPLFVSHRQLDLRRTPFPRATTRWALDSGGYTELDARGGWETSPATYVAAVRRYMAELGSMDWASPQDWMCEPWILKNTGRTVQEHQVLTVANFLLLRRLAPEIPFIPVLQGWTLADYDRCADRYEAAGVRLADQAAVGVGSVCRRQSTEEIGAVFTHLAARGLSNLHGFGVKRDGLAIYGGKVSTADSMSWSYRARREAHDRRARGLTGSVSHCTKTNCANCKHFAIEWRARLLAAVA